MNRRDGSYKRPVKKEKKKDCETALSKGQECRELSMFKMLWLSLQLI